VHARLLDVLHDRADVGLAPVGDRVDVDLQRAFDEAVDQHRALDRTEIVRGVADSHRSPTEHVRGTDQDRKADALCDRARLRGRACDPPLRTPDAETVQEGAEALAVLGQVDRVERCPDDRVAGCFEPARELQRRLATELNRDAAGLLPFANREHLETVSGLQFTITAS